MFKLSISCTDSVNKRSADKLNSVHIGMKKFGWSETSDNYLCLRDLEAVVGVNLNTLLFNSSRRGEFILSKFNFHFESNLSDEDLSLLKKYTSFLFLRGDYNYNLLSEDEKKIVISWLRNSSREVHLNSSEDKNLDQTIADKLCANELIEFGTNNFERFLELYTTDHKIEIEFVGV
jgi:hypothetical protein